MPTAGMMEVGPSRKGKETLPFRLCRDAGVPVASERQVNRKVPDYGRRLDKVPDGASWSP